MTDSQTIGLCKRGIEQGHAQLYKDCAPYVYSHVKRYIWDVEFRKDIMQEVFAKIFINIKNFDPEKGNFKPWIKKITVNECLQHIRKIRPLSVAKGIDEAFDLKDEIVLPTALTRADIELILKDMPKGYKIIFMLVVIDGFTHKEISHKLNIVEQSSRSQLTRAKKWIRQYLLNNNVQQDLYGLF